MSEHKPSLSDLRIDRASAPKRNVNGYWLLAAICLLSGGAAAAYWFFGRAGIVEVRTVAAREAAGGSNDRTVLNASGYVTARRAATVSSKVTGKVVEVLIEEGMRVEQGQVLARLDDTNLQASLRLAQARLASATNALEETRVRIREAEQELKRQVDLLQNSIATRADFERAEAATLALRAHLQQQAAEVVVAEREVASWEQQVDDTIIRAAFAGVVTVKNAQPGEMISPISAGSGFTRTGICTIVDMESLEIEIDVNESYINRVEPGQLVQGTLDAYPEWKIPCKVIAIIPTADRQKSTVKVRVGFEALDKRILPEMGVKVAFREVARSESGNTVHSPISVPKAAIQKQDGREVVFLLKDGRIERRAVTTGSVSAEVATIASGISAGERVVVESREALMEGMRAREAKP